MIILGNFQPICLQIHKIQFSLFRIKLYLMQSPNTKTACYLLNMKTKDQIRAFLIFPFKISQQIILLTNTSYNQLRQDRMLNNIRPAFHAGSWYTQVPQKLDDELSQYLKNAKPDLKEPIHLKGIIGPHAGFYYSGPTAAWAYKYLHKPEKQKRVFLLGPSHHVYLAGCGLTTREYWETPLGKVAIDKKITDELKSKGKFKYVQPDDEDQEHSLEMHLPYIRKCLGQNFRLVPIMVGATDFSMQQQYGKLFAPYFDDPDTIFIISSDFCHWGKRFQYKKYNSEHGQIWQSIERVDGQGMNLIQNHDSKGFEKYISETQNTICGRHPIAIYLSMLGFSKLKLKTQFVKYSQSEKVKTQNQSSVSYASSVTYVTN